MVKAASKTPRAGTQGTRARAARKSGGSAPRKPNATRPAADASRPKKARATVRIYRQGLGDCILVRVPRRSGKDFKMLIDCGVVLGTPDPKPLMTRVVEDIVQATGGEIDVLAITHEHWDHLSGFNQAADSFKKLKVGEIWVAWTEDPKDDLAKQLKDELGKAEQALAASAMRLAAVGATETAALLPDLAATTIGLTGAGGGGSTKAAFDFAKSMAGSKPLRIWRPTDKPFPIPGTDARIYALGPPHDPKLIRKINPSKSSPETYALAIDGGGVMPVGVVSALSLDDQRDSGAPFHLRTRIPSDVAKSIDFFKSNYYENEDWRRIDGDWLGVATDLALALQSYTNNTSLVFALELGEAGKGDVLLFAGDAQVGNWESWQDCAWPEDNPKVTGPGLLAKTIFYKVGHHGSHNATLKDHGVEQMKALQAAVIPVDEVMAKKKRWGSMPLPVLIDALKAKVRDGRVLRTDETPTKTPNGVTVAKDYFELAF